MVSFGGAYALLAYMAQQAVETHHWMTAPEMVDGLGLAETTPGPLILVTQFVGLPRGVPRRGAVLAGHGRHPRRRDDHVGHVHALDAVDLAGAPFVEQLRANRHLSGALAAITRRGDLTSGSR